MIYLFVEINGGDFSMKQSSIKKTLDDFVAELTDQEKSENTIKKYRLVINKLDDYLKDHDIEDIHKADLIRFKQDYLLKKFKASTIRNYITIINKFVRFHENKDLEDKRKCGLELRQIKEQHDPSIENVISFNEYKRMLRYAKKLEMYDMYLIIDILARTGIRVSELKDFTVENLKSKTIVRTLSKGKVREIFIPKKLKEKINKYISDNNIADGYIFKARRSDKLISRKTIDYKLKKIAGAARIKRSKAHAHAFRHLFAKQYLEKGKNIAHLADIMGHSSIETTRRYTRTTADEKKRDIEDIYM